VVRGERRGTERSEDEDEDSARKRPRPMVAATSPEVNSIAENMQIIN
jgi:hypothetical protein